MSSISQRKKAFSGENRGILYAIMITLIFVLLLVAGVGGLLLYQTQGDFYSAFRGRLGQSFYLSAFGMLVATAVLYTPFSYGISYYFILAADGNARFSAFFYLFRHPALLIRAMLISVIKKILIYWERLLLLLMAAVIEVVLFFGFLLVSGSNVFDVKENPFTLAAEFMLGSPWLIGLSVGLWSLVLLGIFGIELRYILCKYVFLCYPEIGLLQAIRVGRFAICGNWGRTLGFYLRYGAYCVLTVLTLGFRKRNRAGHRNFSSFACELAKEGFARYCRRRSRR